MEGFGRNLRGSWGILRVSWADLGAVCVDLRVSRGDLEGSWTDLGAFSGYLGVVFGTILGISCGILEVSWRRLEGS